MWSLPHRGGAFSQGDSVPIPIPANSTLRFSAALKQKSLIGMSRAFSPLALRRSSVLIMGAICALGVSNATTLSVVGPNGVSSSFTATVGNSIEVGVLTDSFSDLYAWQFDLNWDPTILSLNGVTEGGALASAGTTFFVPGTIDNVGGSATANADTVIGGASGATGTNRVLAYFDFSAIGVGKTAITINNVTLLDSNLNHIDETTAPGTMIVGGGGAVPEPGTIGLLGVITVPLVAWQWSIAINCDDLAIVKASFGKKTGQTGFDPRADVNGDGAVNVLDLAAVSQQVAYLSPCNSQ